ncbi:MAG: hypothetical protein LAC69_05370 [Chlorobium sp.]|jgi:hypothetical protein|nr:hypothetical protein [Chlorobium sp.]
MRLYLQQTSASKPGATGRAQHALSADVENLDDAIGISGDTRKIGAIENRRLQGVSLICIQPMQTCHLWRTGTTGRIKTEVNSTELVTNMAQPASGNCFILFYNIPFKY